MACRVARYGPTDRAGQAELGVTVTDTWQRRGIATLLIRALMRFARAHGFRELTGVVLPDNQAMLALARSLGFTIDYDSAEHVMKISHQLGDPVAAACESDSAPGSRALGEIT